MRFCREEKKYVLLTLDYDENEAIILTLPNNTSCSDGELFDDIVIYDGGDVYGY